MNREKTRRAFEIFDQTCDLPESERQKVIDSLCKVDQALRQLVENLLRQDESSSDLFEPGEGATQVAAQIISGEQPNRLGVYVIDGIIGQGGMGVVYQARQESPKRRVALKVIRSPIIGDEVLSRFRREAEVLGQLQHPGIAHVYEAGVDLTCPQETGPVLK